MSQFHLVKVLSDVTDACESMRRKVGLKDPPRCHEIDPGVGNFYAAHLAPNGHGEIPNLEFLMPIASSPGSSQASRELGPYAFARTNFSMCRATSIGESSWT